MKSSSMFRLQPGFSGVFFASSDERRVVITLWRDRSAAEALADSVSYRTTVAELEATGLLRGTPTLELYEIAAYSEPAADGC